MKSWPPITNDGLQVRLPNGKKATVKVTLSEEDVEVVNNVPPVTKLPAPIIETVHKASAWLPPEFPGNTKQGERPELAVLDHPYIGGKVTVFVLTWGDNLPLIQRCLESIIRYVPAYRLDIRVGANQVSKKVREWLDGFRADVITKVYYDDKERRKYPCMREMFRDKSCPITTEYLLWFDDDSHVVDPMWLVKLGKEIRANHPHNVRMYGAKMIHDLNIYIRKGGAPQKWFQTAPWWKGKHLHVNKGFSTAPNGTQIIFCSGGFWALHKEAMEKADIPCPRLGHNGGDICCGAQLHQAGFKIKDFSSKKEIVRWSDAPRRGVTERFLWDGIR